MNSSNGREGSLEPVLIAPTRAFAAPSGTPATVVSLASRLRVAAKQSAQIGDVGDFFEVYQHADGRVSVVVADVCGSGAGAALVAAELRPALHTALVHGDSPGQVLEGLNARLERLGVPDRFVTAVALRLDAVLGVGELACAGHLGPFVRHADGFAEPTTQATGVPLGLLAGEGYVERTLGLALSPGDTLVFVTDGITDPLATDDDPLGTGELAHRIEDASDSRVGTAHDAASLCHALLVDGMPLRDDATVLVLQIPGQTLIPAAA